MMVGDFDTYIQYGIYDMPAAVDKRTLTVVISSHIACRNTAYIESASLVVTFGPRSQLLGTYFAAVAVILLTGCSLPLRGLGYIYIVSSKPRFLSK
jgi:hypothetical protein